MCEVCIYDVCVCINVCYHANVWSFECTSMLLSVLFEIGSLVHPYVLLFELAKELWWYFCPWIQSCHRCTVCTDVHWYSWLMQTDSRTQNSELIFSCGKHWESQNHLSNLQLRILIFFSCRFSFSLISSLSNFHNLQTFLESTKDSIFIFYSYI